jgi:hypothetical protein
MAQAPNLNPVAQNVVVNVGLDTTADFDLTQVERRQEQVTVTGEPPLVEGRATCSAKLWTSNL